MENLVDEIVKRMYPNYDGRYDDESDKKYVNIFRDNAYFDEIDKMLDEPFVEPSVDRSTEVYYFV